MATMGYTWPLARGGRGLGGGACQGPLPPPHPVGGTGKGGAARPRGREGAGVRWARGKQKKRHSSSSARASRESLKPPKYAALPDARADDSHASATSPFERDLVKLLKKHNGRR